MQEKIRFGESVVSIMRGMQDDGWNVIAILSDEGKDTRLIIPGKNIVTNDGDVYYAQKSAGDSVTDDFTAGGMRLGTSSSAVAKSDTDVTTFGTDGDIAASGGYPKANDGDGDNTGAGTDIVTWRFSYGTGDGNISGIQEGAITDSLSSPTAALTHFLFSGSFSKTSSNTLIVFVNHRFNGV